MYHPFLIRMLSSWSPANHNKAVQILSTANRRNAREFALHLDSMLDDETQRSAGVWALATLLTKWRESEDWDSLPKWERSLAAWEVIRQIRQVCIERLIVLRVGWFGWSAWDDCLILAPLASIEDDRYYEGAADILADIASVDGPVATEATQTLQALFEETRANLVEYQRFIGPFPSFSKRFHQDPWLLPNGWHATQNEFGATTEMEAFAR